MTSTTLKTIRLLNTTIGVPNGAGGVAMEPPGTSVEMDAAEADRVLARFGGEVQTPKGWVWADADPDDGRRHASTVQR